MTQYQGSKIYKSLRSDRQLTYQISTYTTYIASFEETNSHQRLFKRIFLLIYIAL